MKKILFIAISTLIASPSFAAVYKMYDKPHAVSQAGCDRYTKLDLNVNGNSGYAALSEQVAGGCEIFVAPNPRQYSVVLESSDCGTKVYMQDPDGDEAGSVEITDNRRRMCENVIPAAIVLKEFSPSGKLLRTLFSQDR